MSGDNHKKAPVQATRNKTKILGSHPKMRPKIDRRFAFADCVPAVLEVRFWR